MKIIWQELLKANLVRMNTKKAKDIVKKGGFIV